VITRPIDALMEAIGEIRRGNLGFKARILSTDEIGQAGEAFNRMSEELRRSQDKIIRGEKLAAVGQLASGVGHELRNPLAAIRNAIFYLRDQLKDSPAAAEDPSLLEFLAIADREIIAANNIIRDLLDFARVPVLDIHPADVNAIALEARSILETPAGIAWDMELSQDLPQIPIDAFRIRQVFVNLGGNAIQAMPKGGVLHVATTAIVGSDSETWIHIVFRDTGYGMSKETMSRIFEPLFSTKTTGTGLGLAISLGIVERHGGRITVESVVGRGTTFTVKLPAHPPVGA
jgi:signal transduction histidine kinase